MVTLLLLLLEAIFTNADVLKLVCKEAKVGVTPLELCELGDNTLTQMLAKVYHKHDHLPV